MKKFEEKFDTHVVVKKEDLLNAFTSDEAVTFANLLDKVEGYRFDNGKKIRQSYFVINRDEPYANEILEIIKRHETIDVPYQSTGIILGVKGLSGKGALTRTYGAAGATVEFINHDKWIEPKTSLDGGWPFNLFEPVQYKDKRFIKLPLVNYARTNDDEVISDTASNDIPVFPLFRNADGSIAPFRLLQVAQDQSSISLNDFRKYARSLGSEFSVFSALVDAYLKIIFKIQFATRDSKSIFPGYVAWKNNEPAKAYATDIITTPSGYLPNGQFKWLGLEDIFGNRYELMDGILTQNDEVFVCDDPSKHASEITSDYVKAGKLPREDGWLGSTAPSETHPWLDLPSEITDEKDESPFSNYYWSPYEDDDVQTIITGGSWVSVDVAGLWSWVAYYLAWDDYSYVGGRLLVSL